MGAPFLPTYPFAAPQATIAGGAALSGAVYLGDGELVALQLPSTPSWTTAAITFQGSYDGNTFYELYDAAGNEIEIPAANVAVGRQIQMSMSGTSMASPITPIDFRGVSFIKVRSGTSASPVNQTNTIVINLIVKKRRGGQ